MGVGAGRHQSRSYNFGRFCRHKLKFFVEKTMKIALVYDRVNKIGGAERILVALHEIWPDAPLYTAVYNPQTAPWARDFKVIPSFLQKFPWAKTKHEFYPYLMPLAFESFSARGGPASGWNFDEYDMVISVTSEAAKGIITKPKTLHLCYCLTPTRYLWSHHDLYFKDGLFKFFTTPLVSYLRFWDKIASQRPDFYLAISENVRQRIKKYYGRDAKVAYPPVSLGFRVQGLGSRENAKKANAKPYTLVPRPYFLIVSRLVPYKRIDIAVEAFNKLGWTLKIVGIGSEMEKLKKMARPNIEFLGELTEEELLGYYQNCQALIFPGEEDLGLVPIEVQACGKPVIAYKGGGALETVVKGVTGEFFYPQEAGALTKVLKTLQTDKYRPEDCWENAKRFNQEGFKKEFQEIVEDTWQKYQKNQI